MKYTLIISLGDYLVINTILWFCYNFFAIITNFGSPKKFVFALKSDTCFFFLQKLKFI